jgi:hypothetical protein
MPVARDVEGASERIAADPNSVRIENEVGAKGADGR